MRVFVTDGENRATLAITRALGRLGHHVIVGERRADSPAQASRYCRERVVYPDPAVDSGGFVESLARLTREHRADVLMPVADITTFLVTDHREAFACAIPCARAEVVARAADKVDIVRTASRIGVPVPTSVIVADSRHVPSVDHLGFPLVIKPWRSRIPTSRGWAATSVSYAESASALARDLEARPRHEFPVLLQELLVGPGVGVFACVHEGRPVATFSHRRLRERPPWGGVSVLCESAEVDSIAGGYATRLLEEIGWQGAAMVEFKRDQRDGVPKLMEINGRFWGSLQLAIDAGVNFPALVLQTVSGEPFPPQAPYRVGLRERWFWGDVDALLVSLRPGRHAARLGGRSKAQAVRDFLEFRAADLHYDNPKWDDVAPFASETKAWLRMLVQGARRSRTWQVAAAPSAPARQLSVESASQTTLAAPLRVRMTSSFEDVGLDESAWNSLVARSDTNSVFLTHQWARSWLAVYGGDRQLLFVVANDASGVRGVMPLVVDRTPANRVARFVGDGRADYSDVLAPAGEPEVATAMLDALLASDCWDSLDLHNIPERSQTPAALRRCCARAGFPVVFDADTICPALIIQGHEDEARRILDKPSLRRRLNHFARTGSLVVRHLTDAAEILPMLDQFFEQHVSRWAGSTSPSLFNKERNRDFYRTLTRNLAGTPWLLFTAVQRDGRPIALHYGFDYDGVVTWYKPSFDPAVAENSPGLALLRQLIEHAVTERRRELDFTWGAEPFKARFTNQQRRTIRLQVFRHPARYVMTRVGRSLRAAARRLTRT